MYIAVTINADSGADEAVAAISKDSEPAFGQRLISSWQTCKQRMLLRWRIP